MSGEGRAGVLLRVEGVSIEFEGVHALEDVSFEVPRGGVTAVIGPNGAGKTTLLNCVTGLYRASGSIRLDGVELTGRAPQACARLGIARTFQTPALVPELSVLENVVLGANGRMAAGLLGSILALPGIRAEERRVRREARELLARLIHDLPAEAPVVGLPHRDRRLVETARALFSRPRLLLLDEPAAGSTPAEGRELVDRAAAAAAELDATVVLVEHNVPLVLGVARHVVVLDHGRVLAAGSPDEVRVDEQVISAYLGTVV